MSQMNGPSQWNCALDLGVSLIWIWMYAQELKVCFNGRFGILGVDDGFDMKWLFKRALWLYLKDW